MEVVYNDEDYTVTSEMKEAYLKHGYITVRQLFSQEEITQLQRNYEEGEDYHKNEYQVKDADEQHTIQTTWTFPGNDAFGMAARTQKIVETCSQLLGGEVYHFHSKIVITEPKTPEQRTWHQDYGCWNNFLPFPDLITAFIAIDPVEKTSGCLQVLDSSHTTDRSEHTLTGSEVCSDRGGTEQLHKDCPLICIELQPGDVVFLHSNILYKNDANSSDVRRMAFIPVYNLKSNSPVSEGIYPGYVPLDVVYNDAVIDCENYTDLDGKGFLDMHNPEYLKAVLGLDNASEVKDIATETS